MFFNPAETFLVPTVCPKKPFCIISLSISFSIQIWQLSIQNWYVKIQKSVSFEGIFDRFGVFGKVVGMDEDYTGKNWYTEKKFSWFLNSLFVTKNWFTKKHYFRLFFTKKQLFRKFQNGQKIFDRVMIFWKNSDFSKKSKKKIKKFDFIFQCKIKFAIKKYFSEILIKCTVFEL